MPLIRIDVIAGRTDEELAAIGDAVHRALVTCFGVPARDRFQVITEHRRAHSERAKPSFVIPSERSPPLSFRASAASRGIVRP